MLLPLKPFYFILGWLFFTAGFIAIFLPVLPTTPFMILALWSFSNSSQRFHDWLYEHRTFGPPLQRWRQYRVIPLSGKLLSITMMSASFTYILIFRELAWWIYTLTGALMLYAAWFVLSKPSRPPTN